MGERKSYRIESIDLLRGLVMIIMALDHVRDYFNYGSFFSDPTNLATTTPVLFFTRWITHFCAPVFVFLAGTSAFLYGMRRQNIREVSWFLFTRGLWLIFLELTVVNFAWTFDITLGVHIFQVIWAIGMSMIILAALIFLPKIVLLISGILLIAGHNLLDTIVVRGAALRSVIWYMLHQKYFLVLSKDSAISFLYPLIPWIGVMIIGYLFGEFYRHDFDGKARRRWLMRIGWGAVLLFVLLRSLNIYGDPSPWEKQSSSVFTLLSFLDTTKYPPSLLFLLMTIGPSLIFLSLAEHVKNRISDMLVTVGGVPLFFYVVHIYLVHVLGILGVRFSGRPWSDMILSINSFMYGTLNTYGYNLLVVYAVWMVVVLAMFPFCRMYKRYKMDNLSKWWLSYL